MQLKADIIASECIAIEDVLLVVPPFPVSIPLPLPLPFPSEARISHRSLHPSSHSPRTQGRRTAEEIRSRAPLEVAEQLKREDAEWRNRRRVAELDSSATARKAAELEKQATPTANATHAHTRTHTRLSGRMRTRHCAHRLDPAVRAEPSLS